MIHLYVPLFFEFILIITVLCNALHVHEETNVYEEN
jgi:hypothetical protein